LSQNYITRYVLIIQEEEEEEEEEGKRKLPKSRGVIIAAKNMMNKNAAVAP
jgi:tetrahydromethanopterin S-methyltransferase subunit A